MVSNFNPYFQKKKKKVKVLMKELAALSNT